jgi:hypothetical protein
LHPLGQTTNYTSFYNWLRERIRAFPACFIYAKGQL